MAYSDNQIKFIIELKESNSELTWEEIQEKFNEEFPENKKSKLAVKKTYHRYKDIEFKEDVYLTNLRQVHSAKNKASQVSKENKMILTYLEKQDEMLDAVKELIKSSDYKKLEIPKYKKDKKKKNMTMEAISSDWHIGRKQNDNIVEKVKNYAQTVIDEVERHEKLFNVEKIILPMLGDFVENASFHGMESALACSLSDSEQEVQAIDMIFRHFILPIAATGRKIVVPCVTGNHDRRRKDKNYTAPGKENRSWTIYKVVEMLAEQAGLKNVEFIIPEGLYCTYNIYGDIALYEHGDESGSTKTSLEAQIAKRSKQIGRLINYIRIGNWHEYSCMDRGRIIINGSPCDIDQYADSKGYHSQPCQVINYYVENDKRPDSFYLSFPVYV